MSSRENAAQAYDLDELLQRIPTGRGLMVAGFSPWALDCQHWTRSVRETPFDIGDDTLTRTIWDDPQNADARVLIDVYECRSAGDAARSLVRTLSGNQLGRLPHGPAGLGDIAYMHPQHVPPAVFFVRGNLSVLVASFGREQVPVVPWAQRIDGRLLDRPESTRPLAMLQSDEDARAGEDVALTVTLPWRLHEDEYVKVFVEGGTVTRGPDTALVIRPERPGQLLVEAFLVEPDRPAHIDRSSHMVT